VTMSTAGASVVDHEACTDKDTKSPPKRMAGYHSSMSIAVKVTSNCEILGVTIKKPLAGNAHVEKTMRNNCCQHKTKTPPMTMMMTTALRKTIRCIQHIAKYCHVLLCLKQSAPITLENLCFCFQEWHNKWCQDIYYQLCQKHQTWPLEYWAILVWGYLPCSMHCLMKQQSCQPVDHVLVPPL